MGSAFHQLCPRYSGTLTPTAPTAIRLWDTFTYFACKWWGKRGAVVEWLERRGYGAESRRKIVSSRLGNFLCQPSSKWVTFSNQGKIRQRKERDGLRPSFAVPMIQWDCNPTAPTTIRLWETFPLTFRWGVVWSFSLAFGISGSFCLYLGGGSM